MSLYLAQIVATKVGRLLKNLLEMSSRFGIVLYTRYGREIGIPELIFIARRQHLLKVGLYFVMRVSTNIFWPIFLQKMIVVTTQGAQFINTQFHQNCITQQLVCKNESNVRQMKARFNFSHGFQYPGIHPIAFLNANGFSTCLHFEFRILYYRANIWP